MKSAKNILGKNLVGVGSILIGARRGQVNLAKTIARNILEKHKISFSYVTLEETKRYGGKVSKYLIYGVSVEQFNILIADLKSAETESGLKNVFCGYLD